MLSKKGKMEEFFEISKRCQVFFAFVIESEYEMKLET